jgi:hypothetical protein
MSGTRQNIVFQIYKFIEFSMICQGIAQKKSLSGNWGKMGENHETLEKKCGVKPPDCEKPHPWLLTPRRISFINLSVRKRSFVAFT